METKFILSEKDLPGQWYNIQADLGPGRRPRPSTPAPSSPSGPQDLAPLFPMALIMQEVSQERYIDIPEEVREIYRCGGPRRC